MTSHTFPSSGDRTWKWDSRTSQPLSGMGTRPDPSRKSRGQLLEVRPDVGSEGAASGKVRMIRTQAITSPGHQSRITQRHTETLPHATTSHTTTHAHNLTKASQPPLQPYPFTTIIPDHNHTHRPYGHIPHTTPLTRNCPITRTRLTFHTKVSARPAFTLQIVTAHLPSGDAAGTRLARPLLS